MSIRVYRYGLLAPTEGADLVREQMRAAHRYRNTLVEIERGRRAAQRELLSSQPTLTPLERRNAENPGQSPALRESRWARAKHRSLKVEPERKVLAKGQTAP